jgi:hypothetical protein
MIGHEDLGSFFVTFSDVRKVVEAVSRLGEYDNSAMPPIDKIPLSGKSSLASIVHGEKDQERFRENDKKEIPTRAVPPIPLKCAHDATVNVKGPLPPTKGSSYYPLDIKHPYPPPPSSTLSCCILLEFRQEISGTRDNSSLYRYSTCLFDDEPYAFASQQPQPNPIHAVRRQRLSTVLAHTHDSLIVSKSSPIIKETGSHRRRSPSQIVSACTIDRAQRRSPLWF